jgi:hypothetical protein
VVATGLPQLVKSSAATKRPAQQWLVSAPSMKGLSFFGTIRGRFQCLAALY